MKEIKRLPIGSVSFAQRLALQLSAFWTASFLCSMFSYRYAWLGILCPVLALYSLFVLSRGIAFYHIVNEVHSFVKRVFLGIMTCLFCTLVTTLVQYMYFAFVDGGRMMAAMLQLLEIPQYSQLIANMNPAMPMEEVIETFSKMTVNDIVRSIFMFNVFISLPFGVIAALMSLIWKAKYTNKPEQ